MKTWFIFWNFFPITQKLVSESTRNPHIHRLEMICATCVKINLLESVDCLSEMNDSLCCVDESSDWTGRSKQKEQIDFNCFCNGSNKRVNFLQYMLNNTSCASYIRNCCTIRIIRRRLTTWRMKIEIKNSSFFSPRKNTQFSIFNWNSIRYTPSQVASGSKIEHAGKTKGDLGM